MTLADTTRVIETDERTATTADERTVFARDGLLGPLRIFTPAECRRIAAYLHRPDRPAPLDWEKGRAVRERFLYDLAAHPALLPLIVRILGENVVLWGVSAVIRGPGATHPWHSDIESSAPDGGFATAWIGIEGTTRESALQMISRSHRMGRTVQEFRAERGLRRDLVTPEMMLSATRERDPQASLVQPDMTDGDAVVFDGRLWHGSHNTRSRGRRLALLLQYAAADSPVRIPDLSQLDWPFRLRARPQPPVILVSGFDQGNTNRLVPAPPPDSNGRPMVSTAIHQIVLPLEHPTRDWEAFPAFSGPTTSLTEMSCHASVLKAGHFPHPPHAHRAEELLIPLHGEVELVIAKSPDDPTPRVERLGPSAFIYYPAGQHHTIRNPGTAPVGYLMFKWFAPPLPRANSAPPSSTCVCRYNDGVADVVAGASTPQYMRRVFEQSTAYLGKLHSHVTTLEPGAGYEPHVDAYDVAIVTLSGTVETLGQKVEPLSVIYYAAGELHGMRNIGREPARYLVFEFHAPGVSVAGADRPRHRVLAGRALRLGKRLARPIWDRLRPH